MRTVIRWASLTRNISFTVGLGWPTNSSPALQHTSVWKKTRRRKRVRRKRVKKTRQPELRDFPKPRLRGNPADRPGCNQRDARIHRPKLGHNTRQVFPLPPNRQSHKPYAHLPALRASSSRIPPCHSKYRPPWRTHSCVPRRHSCRRRAGPLFDRTPPNGANSPHESPT